DVGSVEDLDLGSELKVGHKVASKPKGTPASDGPPRSRTAILSQKEKLPMLCTRSAYSHHLVTDPENAGELSVDQLR
ncbi:hypothetical protein, partial [Amaricoccus sp. W119]|uniref:hypothetical protein n=1 Tax=Amaricoccus sp. W119 TaxID=3391833 RepID=UPI0039A4A0A3